MWECHVFLLDAWLTKLSSILTIAAHSEEFTSQGHVLFYPHGLARQISHQDLPTHCEEMAEQTASRGGLLSSFLTACGRLLFGTPTWQTFLSVVTPNWPPCWFSDWLSWCSIQLPCRGLWVWSLARPVLESWDNWRERVLHLKLFCKWLHFPFLLAMRTITCRTPLANFPHEFCGTMCKEKGTTFPGGDMGTSLFCPPIVASKRHIDYEPT